MKLHKIILLIFCFAAILETAAQEAPKPEKCADYDERFKKLKELHIAHFYSEESLKPLKMQREFLRKLNRGSEVTAVPQDVLHYIIDNLEKTHFTSYEAAEMELALLKQAEKTAAEAVLRDVGTEKSDYITYITECVKQCGPAIISAVFTEVAMENRELLRKQ